MKVESVKAEGIKVPIILESGKELKALSTAHGNYVGIIPHWNPERN